MNMNEDKGKINCKPKKHLNKKFKINRTDLENLIGTKITKDPCFDYIVPPKEIVKLEHIKLLEYKVIRAIVHNVPIRNTDDCLYSNSTIGLYRLSPEVLKIGQSFVLKNKILDLCEFSENFKEFAMPGISKLPPVLLCGKNEIGEDSCGIYFPPLVEKHKDDMVLIDGIHRSYLIKSAGTTMTYIVVSSPSKKLPFDPQNWSHAKLSDTRPAIVDRYVNLDMALFRDLGRVGLDG